MKKRKKLYHTKPKQHSEGVKAKKYLGQHFLNDEATAKKIAQTLTFKKYIKVIEIGPGTGMLTKYLLEEAIDLYAIDLDKESIAYLKTQFQLLYARNRNNIFEVIEGDILKMDLTQLLGEGPFAITGNFPYNISSQIVFKMLENRSQIPEFTGMFQKEVAARICEQEGSKTYGVLSVLVQAFYHVEYLFTVAPEVFTPPPKVQSGVIRLTRKEAVTLACSEKLFFTGVKTAFGQRRKTLRNSLKTFNLSDNLKEDAIFDKRPEQLSVNDFISLTVLIENDMSDIVN